MCSLVTNLITQQEVLKLIDLWKYQYHLMHPTLKTNLDKEIIKWQKTWITEFI